MNLLSLINESRNTGIGIGHFNVSDSVMLRAIFMAAQKLSGEAGRKIPIIIGVSEGEREFLGSVQIVALVKSLRDEHDYPIFLNADHTHSVEKALAAAKAGYDAILFDGSKLSFEENVRQTREVVTEVKKIQPNILVEGEIGYIGSSSKILKEIPEGAAITAELLTKPEEAQRFVEATGIDLFAPAVGNLHGMLSHAPNPALNIERITELAHTISIPMVLHGGSGLRREEFVNAITAGIGIVHVSTELRVAWRNALTESLQHDPEEITPYRIFEPVVSALHTVVEDKLRIFQKI